MPEPVTTTKPRLLVMSAEPQLREEQLQVKSTA